MRENAKIRNKACFTIHTLKHVISSRNIKFLSPSAVIEHTNRVIYLEDNDVASVVDGSKS